MFTIYCPHLHSVTSPIPTVAIHTVFTIVLYKMLKLCIFILYPDDSPQQDSPKVHPVNHSQSPSADHPCCLQLPENM